MMKYVSLIVAVLLVGGCDTGPSAREQEEAAEMRTIHSTPPQPARLNPPPMLEDEMPPPKPKALPWEKPAPIVLSAEDEKLRSSLPFSPAIAMDPVDGSKISIRANTPTYELKGRIYYFSSDANRKTFVAGPEQYLTGRFTQL